MSYPKVFDTLQEEIKKQLGEEFTAPINGACSASDFKVSLDGKEIFVTSEILDEYFDSISYRKRNRGEDGIYFRGIKVKQLDETS